MAYTINKDLRITAHQKSKRQKIERLRNTIDGARIDERIICQRIKKTITIENIREMEDEKATVQEENSSERKALKEVATTPNRKANLTESEIPYKKLETLQKREEQ